MSLAVFSIAIRIRRLAFFFLLGKVVPLYIQHSRLYLQQNPFEKFIHHNKTLKLRVNAAY